MNLPDIDIKILIPYLHLLDVFALARVSKKCRYILTGLNLTYLYSSNKTKLKNPRKYIKYGLFMRFLCSLFADKYTYAQIIIPAIIMTFQEKSGFSKGFGDILKL